MTAAPVVSVITADMRRQRPLHPAAQVAVVVRPKHQVEVIGHEAERQDPHGKPLAGSGQNGDEGFVVLVLVEDRRAVVAAVQDVVAIAPNRGACGAWHLSRVRDGEADVKKNVACPLWRTLSPLANPDVKKNV